MSEGFEIFKKEAEDLCKETDAFSYSEGENGVPEISGTLSLTNYDGLHIDDYQIKIVGTPDYPLSFPLVFEVGGRLPVNIDWHVFPDGHCCIKSFPEERFVCRQGITLPSFIEQQVKPFFFNQKHREVHGYFLLERSHGVKGNVEFFVETFKTKDLRTIVNGLLFIKERKEPNRVSKCFCGSGEKYRRCHREAYRRLSLFTSEELDYFIIMIISVA